MQIEDMGDGRAQKGYAGLHDGAMQFASRAPRGIRVAAERVLAVNNSMFGIAGIFGVYAMKHNAFVTDIDQGEIAKAFLVIARRG